MVTAQQGLYLAPPHGELIANGTKVAIAKARPMGLEGKWVLLSGGRAYGHMTIGNVEEVPVEEFRTRQVEHGVSEKERKRWWPERSPLYLYPVESFQPYRGGPIEVDLPPGVQTRVDVKGLGLPTEQRVKISIKAARWRTLKDGRTVAISGTEKRGAMSARGEAAMRSFERYASKKTIEVAACMTPAGETLFRQIGNEESVSFDPDQIRDMEDATLTHNHPGPWGSFSSSDVALASEVNLAEIRVVARDPETDKRYLYRLTRPEGGWDLGPLTIRRSYDSSMDKYKRETWPKIESGALSLQRANFDIRDRIWQEMWPGQYTREEF